MHMFVQSINLICTRTQSSWFRKSRFKQGKGKNAALVGACRGLGFTEGGSGPSNTTSSLPSHAPTYKPGLVTGSILSAAAVSLGSGPASNRLDAMRAAFKQQYVSNVSGS